MMIVMKSDVRIAQVTDLTHIQSLARTMNVYVPEGREKS